MISEDVIILLSCHVDPDRPESGWTGLDKSNISWRCIEEGIPKIKRASVEFTRRTGKQVKVTWFLRADKQMEQVCGDSAWPAHRFKEQWDALKTGQDEIGWHPHFWRWSDKGKLWYQERIDQKWLVDCLAQGHQALRDVFPVTAVSTGWCFHNNVTMQAVSELGLVCDLSAIPGIFDVTKHRLAYDVSDWRYTPVTPYFPSAGDYRRPGVAADALPILEIPTTTHRVPLLSLARALQRRQHVYQANILKHPFFFGRAIASVVSRKRKERPAIFSATFHADEALSDAGLFSSRHFGENLQNLENALERNNLSYTFATATEVAKHFKASLESHVGEHR